MGRREGETEEGEEEEENDMFGHGFQFGAMGEKSSESGVSILDLSSNCNTCYLCDAVKVV